MTSAATKAPKPCRKCNGTGFIAGFAHVAGGRCFRCTTPIDLTGTPTWAPELSDRFIVPAEKLDSTRAKLAETVTKLVSCSDSERGRLESRRARLQTTIDAILCEKD